MAVVRLGPVIFGEGPVALERRTRRGAHAARLRALGLPARDLFDEAVIAAHPTTWSPPSATTRLDVQLAGVVTGGRAGAARRRTVDAVQPPARQRPRRSGRVQP
jgi:hypothetical protein